MAVPGHDAAGLDGQLAEAQLAILDFGGLLFEVDRAEGDVADADRLESTISRTFALHLVGRAFAGKRGRGGRPNLR